MKSQDIDLLGNQPMNIVIFGANEGVGRCLVEQALALSYQVGCCAPPSLDDRT